MTEEGKIAVLIVDDSALMRNVISMMIEADGGLRVEAKASNGAIALRKLETAKPDVIVLDLEMPEMSGIEFLKERRRREIDIPVIILSSIAHRGARITMEALSLGASDFILKPSGTDSGELRRIEQQLVSTLKAYGARYRRRSGEKTEPRRDRIDLHAPIRRAQVHAVAIGISTGGPNALRQLFQELDGSLPAPIFVVQHMPAGFTREFAESLNRISRLEVKEAEIGDVVRPGRAFIAPGDFHMTVERKRLAEVIELNQDSAMNGHRPSVDVLFSSIAKTYGSRTLAVIMTGMGKDGARSIGEIKQAGGITVGQDEESCVVYGMPRVAAQNGYLDEVLPLNSIAEFINRTVLGSASS